MSGLLNNVYSLKITCYVNLIALSFRNLIFVLTIIINLQLLLFKYSSAFVNFNHDCTKYNVRIIL